MKEIIDVVPRRCNASLFPVLSNKISVLGLTYRANECLRLENIVFVGDLVQRTESELLKTTNLGRKSLNEMKVILLSHNLTIGMNLEEWIRPN